MSRSFVLFITEGSKDSYSRLRWNKPLLFKIVAYPCYFGWNTGTRRIINGNHQVFSQFRISEHLHWNKNPHCYNAWSKVSFVPFNFRKTSFGCFSITLPEKFLFLAGIVLIFEKKIVFLYHVMKWDSLRHF